MAPKKSFVWKHFTRVNNSDVSCNVCKLEGRNSILQSGSSTTPLSNHLRTRHSITNVDTGDGGETSTSTGSRKRNLESSDAPAATASTFQPSDQHQQTTLNKFFKSRESLPEYLAKWAAKDHFSVAGMIGCNELSVFLSTRNMSMPKSRETVWKHIESFYQQSFNEQTQNITEQLARGTKFSISLDEWTDLNSRRFLIVFLHDNKGAYNLGLVPIPAGSCTTQVLVSEITKCLEVVGITPYTDLIASTTDGAKTVVNVADVLNVTGQQCINHGIHLAVTDVVYKKVKKASVNVALAVAFAEESGAESEGEESGEEEYELIEPKLIEAVSYVRELFKYFRKSPLKMSQLQTLIQDKKEGLGKEYSLLLDIRTRWNSVLPMIQRYQLISKYIRKCLEMLNEGQMYMTRYDEILQSLTSALKPVQEAVVQLSKHTSNILIGDTTVKYVIEKLRQLDTPLSLSLCESLIERYKQRRKSVEISLLFLLTKKAYMVETDDFQSVTKKDVKLKALHLLERLYPEPETDTDNEAEVNHGLSSTNRNNSKEPLSLAEGIEESFKPEVTPKMNLEREFQMLQALGQLSPRLENLRNALMSIQPTSTICEQGFSVADSFKTKKRNRIGSKRTNGLVWLKGHFNNSVSK